MRLAYFFENTNPLGALSSLAFSRPHKNQLGKPNNKRELKISLGVWHCMDHLHKTLLNWLQSPTPTKKHVLFVRFSDSSNNLQVYFVANLSVLMLTQHSDTLWLSAPWGHCFFRTALMLCLPLGKSTAHRETWASLAQHLVSSVLRPVQSFHVLSLMKECTFSQNPSTPGTR